VTEANAQTHHIIDKDHVVHTKQKQIEKLDSILQQV
jgi:hypothetical protein